MEVNSADKTSHAFASSPQNIEQSDLDGVPTRSTAAKEKTKRAPTEADTLFQCRDALA
jgi:hypothetical protein